MAKVMIVVVGLEPIALVMIVVLKAPPGGPKG